MSAIAQPAAGQRPATVTAAAALLALVVALTLAIVLAGYGGFDPAFLAIAGALAALKLIAAAGLWRCRRWAAILGFIVTLLDTLLALPSFVDGSGGEAGAVLAGGVAIGILTLVLLVLPTSRRAYV